MTAVNYARNSQREREMTRRFRKGSAKVPKVPRRFCSHLLNARTRVTLGSSNFASARMTTDEAAATDTADGTDGDATDRFASSRATC